MSGPRVIQVVGRSGAGKTLALVAATRLLRAQGLRVAVLKHSHHPMDLPGKDTTRLRASGADPVIFASDRTVIIGSWNPVGLLPLLPVDVVLVEGYQARRMGRERFPVQSPRDAPDVAKAIAQAVSEPRRRVEILVDGRRPPDGDAWMMVANLMELRELKCIKRSRAGGAVSDSSVMHRRGSRPKRRHP